MSEAVKVYQKIPSRKRFVKRIVYEVYEGNIDNLKLVLDFNEAMPEEDLKYLVLKAIYEEMSINGNLNHLQSVFLYLKMRTLSESGNIKNLDDIEIQELRLSSRQNGQIQNFRKI